MAKCSQCDKPAIVGSLCVDHYFKWVQANYMLFAMTAAQMNVLQEEISAGTGGLIPPHRMEIPPLPSYGDSLTFNNINITESNIGVINTGTAHKLEASITIMQNSGNSELAEAVKELTNAIIESTEVDKSTKNELAEQLEFLVAQAMAKPENRSMGMVKTILAGLRNSIAAAGGLLAIWDKVEPLIRVALGIG